MTAIFILIDAGITGTIYNPLKNIMRILLLFFLLVISIKVTSQNQDVLSDNSPTWVIKVTERSGEVSGTDE